MNIIFIGSYCPSEKEDYIKSKSTYFDVPGNILQNSILSGLENDKNIDISIISILRVVSDLKKIEGFSFIHNGKSQGLLMDSYSSLIKRKLFNVNNIVKVVLDLNVIPDCIFVYSYSIELLKSIEKIKKHFPNVIIIMMVTDLIIYMSKGGLIKRFLKKIETVVCNKLMNRNVDGYIFLSEHMKGCFPMEGKEFDVIEGIFHSDAVNECSEYKKSDKISFLYTGSLCARYGITDLIQAFSKLKNDNLELWLCGDGDAVPFIRSQQDIDNRIKYFGQVDRSTALRLQHEATILVNPRHSSEEFTKYSFPSKTMEYLASGTPTVMCKLECIPPEYNNHLYYFEDESIEGMSKKMNELALKDSRELEEYGKQAANFILTKKTANIQCKKIIELINKLKNR